MTDHTLTVDHSHHGYITDKDKYLNRLKRIEGQARGIHKMVEDEKYCIDILTQISALTSALEAVALGLLDDHLRHCVVDAAKAVRATREATVARGRDKLSAIIGTPLAGEAVGREAFDGGTEVASFPGDLPDDPAALFARDGFTGLTAQASDTDFRFLRFRPPATEPGISGAPTLPHIRLDRALQFLLGDRLA